MNIFRASRNGDVARIEELLNSGTSVNCRDGRNYNNTALITAAWYNQLEAAKFLYERGCDLNLQNTRGETAVHKAVCWGHHTMVQMLADWGADLEIRNDKGRTPVNQAATNGQLNEVRILANMGANLDTVDNLGRSPAENAFYKRRTETLGVLRDYIPLKVMFLQKNFDDMKRYIQTSNDELKELHVLLRKNTAAILDVVKNSSLKDVENVRKFIGLNRATFHKHRIGNISLIQHIINWDLIHEREIIIDIINMAERRRVGEDKDKDLERELIATLKEGTKTSPGLAGFLKSASSRYPWGKVKFISMCLVTLSSLAIGIGSYSFDIQTDMAFVNDQLYKRRSSDYSDCATNYKEIIEENRKFMETDEKWFKNKTKRLNVINLAQEIINATKCFLNEERFLDDPIKDPSQWRISGTAAWAHVILPLVFIIPLWLVILNRRKKTDKAGCCSGSWRYLIDEVFTAVLAIPLFPINRLVNSFWQIRVHYNEMSRREATKEENVVGIRDDEFYIQRYKKEKERLNLKIDINTNLGKFR